MTNRKWLENMSDEELASFMDKKTSCEICIHGSYDGCGMNCQKNIAEWLKQKHTEPMPELQIGDILYTETGWSYVAISPMTLVGRDQIKQCNIEDINNIVTRMRVKSIYRYDGGFYQIIWRADDDQL